MKRTRAAELQIESRRRIGDERVRRAPESRDDRIAGPVGEVDVEAAARRVVGRERQPEQAALAAARDAAGQIEEVGARAPCRCARRGCARPAARRTAPCDRSGPARTRPATETPTRRPVPAAARVQASRHSRRRAAPPRPRALMERIVTQGGTLWAIMRTCASLVSRWRSSHAACVAGCDKKEPETPDPGNPSWRCAGGSRRSPWMDAAGARRGRHHVVSIRALRRRYPHGAHRRELHAAAGGRVRLQRHSAHPDPRHAHARARVVCHRGGATARARGRRRCGSSPSPARHRASQHHRCSVVTAEQVRLNLSPVAEGLQPSIGSRVRAGWVDLRRRARRHRAPDSETACSSRRRRSICLRSRAAGGRASGDCARSEVRRERPDVRALCGDAPRNGQEFTLARFRVVNDIFGERAVLLDRTPASATGASGALRIGPDGKLYRRARQLVRQPHRRKLCDLQRQSAAAQHSTRRRQTTSRVERRFFRSIIRSRSRSTGSRRAGTMWVVDRVGTDAGRLSAVVNDAETETAPRSAPHMRCPPAQAPHRRRSIAAI